MAITEYNNPFNIRPGQGYAGESGTYKGKDGSEYVIFDSMELGLRAGLVDLRSKIKQKDGDLLEMIKKFAPEKDQNNPNSYFSFVSNKIGKDTVTESDLPELAKAFIEFENTPETAIAYLNQFDSVYNDVNAMSQIDMPTETNLSQAKKLAGLSNGVPVPQRKPDEPAIAQASMPDLITTPTGSPASSQTEMAQLITEPSDPNKTLDIDPIVNDNIISSPQNPISSLTDKPLDLLNERQKVVNDIDNQIDIKLDLIESKLPQDKRPKVVENFALSEMLTKRVKQSPANEELNPDALKQPYVNADVAHLMDLNTNPLASYKFPLVDIKSPYPTDPSADLIQSELIQMNNRDIGDIYSRDDLYPDEYYWFTTDSKQIWSAAFRQYNPLESATRAVDDAMFGPSADLNYDPAQDKRIPQGSLYRFLDSSSYEETTIMLERFRSDIEDMAVIANSDSTIPIVVASLASPSTLAPFSKLKFLQGVNGTQRFIKGSTYGMAVVAPEEFLMAEQLYTRDASHAALVFAATGILSGSLNAALGKSAKPTPNSFGGSGQKRITYDDGNTIDLRRDGFDIDGDPVFRPVGAGVSDDAFQSNLWRSMEQDALKETGVGLEKLGWNPTIRLFKSSSPTARAVVSGLVDVGGLQQKKVDLDIAMDQSIETTFRTTYYSRLRDSIQALDTQYLEYRKIVAAEGDIQRQFQLTGVMFKDIGKTIKGTSNQSHGLVHFRNRVGMAMRRNDTDKIEDSMTPFVNKAAKEYRKLFNFIKDEAQSARLFEREIQGLMKSARAEGNVNLVAYLEKQLKILREQGVTVNTAQSYLPRVPRIDKIMDNQVKFRKTIEKWAIETLGMTPKQANKFSLGVMDSYTTNKPFFDLDDIGGFEDFVKSSSGLKARILTIPDDLIEEFLESDVEILARHHTKTMGIDILLAKKYGDIDMRNVIDAVKADYKKLIDEGGPDAKNLQKRMENDIRDIKGLRDRLRGTYGASKDPHSVSSRFVRAMKSFNVIVGMGGAMVSSVPDIARMVMVEGMDNFYRKGMVNLFKSNQSAFKKMTKSELRKAGVAVDAELGLRASAMSDVGDMMGSRFTWERALSQTAAVTFFMNGLNFWNYGLKNMSGTITMLHMTENIMKPWSKLPRNVKEKFLKNGIDEQSHRRMAELIKRHGQKEDGEWLPNTDLWQDATMRLMFRNAINQNVDRIIITPGAADRALWTSREWGSFATQFKAFGQGAMMRMTTAGLQEKDGSFWQGAFLIVGLGAAVNEIKRLQYGDNRQESYREKLLNAVDRSGIGGWFTDVNNSIEKLTDNKAGLRPFVGAGQPYRPGVSSTLATVAGPSIANMSNAAQIFGDIVTGNANQATLNKARYITPGATLPYLDPIYDGVFGQ